MIFINSYAVKSLVASHGNESRRGQPHSKTSRKAGACEKARQRFGVRRQPYAALGSVRWQTLIFRYGGRVEHPTLLVAFRTFELI